jgi:hypothetical protein
MPTASELADEAEQWRDYRKQAIELSGMATIQNVRKRALQVEELLVPPAVTKQLTTIRNSVRFTECDIQHRFGSMETITSNEEGRPSGRDLRR